MQVGTFVLVEYLKWLNKSAFVCFICSQVYYCFARRKQSLPILTLLLNSHAYITGKFQMQVLPKSGHAVHEDVPDQVNISVLSSVLFLQFYYSYMILCLL